MKLYNIDKEKVRKFHIEVSYSARYKKHSYYFKTLIQTFPQHRHKPFNTLQNTVVSQDPIETVRLYNVSLGARYISDQEEIKTANFFNSRPHTQMIKDLFRYTE